MRLHKPPAVLVVIVAPLWTAPVSVWAGSWPDSEYRRAKAEEDATIQLDGSRFAAGQPEVRRDWSRGQIERGRGGRNGTGTGLIHTCMYLSRNATVNNHVVRHYIEVSCLKNHRHTLTYCSRPVIHYLVAYCLLPTA